MDFITNDIFELPFNSFRPATAETLIWDFSLEHKKLFSACLHHHFDFSTCLKIEKLMGVKDFFLESFTSQSSAWS
jgi:hypothetical protein